MATRPGRRIRRAVAWLSAGVALASSGLLLLAGVLLWATLDDAQRLTLAEVLLPRWPLLLLVVLAVTAAVLAVAPRLVERWVAAPARLREHARILLSTDARPDAVADAWPAPWRGLAHAIDGLAAQRDTLRADMTRRVDAASAGIEQERNRLAALMSELQHSVIVCTLDGRILLFNQRARALCRAWSSAPGLADGAELIGLGRSIHAVLDRHLLAHALERVQQQVQRGAASPGAQFVTTTPAGRLLRVRVAAVRAQAAPADADHAVPAVPVAIDSFVLMLDDITDEHERHAAREQLLHELIDGSRGPLGLLNAAVAQLEDPELPAAQRERLTRTVRDEGLALARRLDELAARHADDAGRGTWPLDEMLGVDIVQAVRRRIEATLNIRSSEAAVDPALWLRLDSFSLMQALVHLSARLRDEFEITLLELRLQPADARRAHLDLIWRGPSISNETVMSWELDPMAGSAGAGGTPLTIREVVTRHGGAFWFERDRARQQAFFRFLLPRAAPAQPASGASPYLRNDSRPEFFDFDLFADTGLGRALDERPLAALAYTVFDTETTGLDPSAGDEIIQIGATRIVNGRLLKADCFEQLIDPQRPIPEASIPIHGITPDQVRGQPTLQAVLPAFRAYAQDTVLVAHNAAFDMRFLQLKEAQTGVTFDLPVLDTLLLSAVVHPDQASHRLEAIAQRFGITVIGRHTALGDAMVTAEVLLKLIPLLANQGIVTLGQAREAARQTWFARLRY